MLKKELWRHHENVMLTLEIHFLIKQKVPASLGNSLCLSFILTFNCQLHTIYIIQTLAIQILYPYKHKSFVILVLLEKTKMSVVREPRSITRKFLARPQQEGLGAVVRRSIGRYVHLREIILSMLLLLSFYGDNFHLNMFKI